MRLVQARSRLCGGSPCAIEGAHVLRPQASAAGNFRGMDLSAQWLDWMQWPAMGATALAAWLVGSDRERRRSAGFWMFLASNVMWILWGLHDGALALIALQIALAALNIRGVFKTEVKERVEGIAS